MTASNLIVMLTCHDVMVPDVRDAFAAYSDCGVSHYGFSGNSGILKRLSLFGLLAVTAFCSRAAVVTYYVSVTNVCGVTVSIDGGAFGEGTTKRYLNHDGNTITVHGTRHRNGRHWAGPYDQIVTGPDGGRFLWKSPGTTIVVR